jgi:hypothetical protein
VVDPVGVLQSTTPVDDVAEIGLEEMQKECLAAFNANAKAKTKGNTLGPKSTLLPPESENDKKLKEMQQRMELIEEGAFVVFFWLFLLFFQKKNRCARTDCNHWNFSQEMEEESVIKGLVPISGCPFGRLALVFAAEPSSDEIGRGRVQALGECNYVASGGAHADNAEGAN